MTSNENYGSGGEEKYEASPATSPSKRKFEFVAVVIFLATCILFFGTYRLGLVAKESFMTKESDGVSDFRYSSGNGSSDFKDLNLRGDVRQDEEDIRNDVTLQAAASVKTVFAHMVNTVAAMRDGVLTQGANGVEMDLHFDVNTGRLTEFRHGGICDCVCTGCPACSILAANGPTFCEASVDYATMMKAMAAADITPKLAVIYIDTKLNDDLLNKGVLYAAGCNTVKALVANTLPAFKGQIVINGAYVKYVDFLKGAQACAKTTSFDQQFFYTLDFEGSGENKATASLYSLGTSNIVYSAGISACAPGAFHTEVKAAINHQLYASVGIWTIDSQSSMVAYINDGVDSIMSNKPSLAIDAFKKAGFSLAAPGSALVTKDRSKAVLDWQCDCDYSSFGGCKISVPAPPGQACKCQYTSGAYTCHGSDTACKDPSSKLCATPDYSKASCVLGGGDCGGYLLNVGEVCSWDRNCANGACGRESAVSGAVTTCCKSGSWKGYGGYSYCTGMPSGTVCWLDSMCASGNCHGNGYGVRKGKC